MCPRGRRPPEGDEEEEEGGREEEEEEEEKEEEEEEEEEEEKKEEEEEEEEEQKEKGEEEKEEEDKDEEEVVVVRKEQQKQKQKKQKDSDEESEYEDHQKKKKKSRKKSRKRERDHNDDDDDDDSSSSLPSKNKGDSNGNTLQNTVLKKRATKNKNAVVEDPLEFFKDTLQETKDTMESYLNLQEDNNGKVQITIDKSAPVRVLEEAPTLTSLEATITMVKDYLVSNTGTCHMIAQNNAIHVVAAQRWKATKNGGENGERLKGKDRQDLYDQDWCQFTWSKRGKSTREKHTRIGEFILKNKWALFVNLPYYLFAEKITQWRSLLQEHEKDLEDTINELNSIMEKIKENSNKKK